MWLLDLDALARDEGEDWIWSGGSIEPSAQHRAILRLSRGGSDAVVLREFDLETRAFLPEGFVLPEAKGGIGWLDPETLLLSSAFGEGMATTSGYARTVRLWHRGQDPRLAEVLFETEATVMSASGYVDRTATPPRLWFVTRPGFFDVIAWLGDRSGARERIDLPTDAVWQVHADVLLVKPRTPWSVAGRTYEPDQLLGLSFSSFMTGDRDFELLFEPAARRSLKGFVWAGDRLALSILDNLAPRFVLLRFVEGVWEREELETLPQTGVVTLRRVDSEAEDSDGTVLVGAQDPITPPTLMLMSVASSNPHPSPAVLKRSPATFDAAGLVVTRHEAVSLDGERIPYTQTGPARETGDAPVHLTGYGGFAVSDLPTYRTSVGKLWFERGGTGVVANIRGGGEFGTRWHEAGRREGKRSAHDDFAAVAADLVRRGVTRPGRIAAEGGSNGGLLIANMLTRYPEAVRCAVLHDPTHRHAPLLEAAGRGELDCGIRRPRRAGRLGVPAADLGLSHGRAGSALSTDPHRDDAPRRPRAPRPCPQDGGQAPGHGLRGLSLRACCRRPRLRQGQCGAGRLHRARLQFHAGGDRVGAVISAHDVLAGRRHSPNVRAGVKARCASGGGGGKGAAARIMASPKASSAALPLVCSTDRFLR